MMSSKVPLKSRNTYFQDSGGITEVDRYDMSVSCPDDQKRVFGIHCIASLRKVD